MPRISLLVLLAIGLPTFRPVSSPAQRPPDASAEIAAQGALRPISVMVSPGGVGRNTAGRWSTASVVGVNRTEQDTVETAAVMIGNATDVQFARRLWIPAGARRQGYMPISVPEDLSPDSLQVEMTSIHLKQTDRGEQFQTNVVGMQTSKRSLLLSWEESRAAALIDPLNRADIDADNLSLLNDTIYSGYDSAVLAAQDLGIVRVINPFLPPVGKPLDPIDQVIVATDRILNDTVGVQTLRTWMQEGGRIWIMVDQIRPESVRALLGDAVPYTIVDRVELNDFEIETVVQVAAGSGTIEKWSSETPAELVRVLTDAQDVHSQIDGWPAAIWQPVGSGEVLFTTLSAHGWRKDELDQNYERPPTATYQSLSSRFFSKRLDPENHAAQLASFLDDDIGYTIPSRVSIAGVLGIHMAIVLAIGTLLYRQKKLHYLAYIVPVAAFAAAGSLVSIGKQKTSAVPSTIATGEIIRVIPNSSQVKVESVSAVFSQEPRVLDIESSQATTTALPEGNSTGEMRRIVWDDSGNSRWMFVKQPPGVIRHVESESMMTTSTPWRVRGRFTEKGLEAWISGLSADECEDAVIVSAAAPASTVRMAGDGSMVSGPGEVLPPDQYLDVRLVTDAQRDRQSLLRELIYPDSPIISREPSLLVWTDPVRAGVKFGDDYVRRGSALTSIPIQFERVPTGTPFNLPAGFVRLDARADGRVTSTIFNAQTGRWLDQMNQPNESQIQCLIPNVLLPCRLDRATVRVKISAPSRTFELRALVDDELQTLHRQDNPTGVLEFEIDRAEALEISPEGRLVLGLAVSESKEALQRSASAAESGIVQAEDDPNRSVWRIDYVHVNVEGTTL